MSVGRGVMWPMTTVEQCRSMDMKDLTRIVTMEQTGIGTTRWMNGDGKETGSIGWIVSPPGKLLITYSITPRGDGKKRDYFYRVGCNITPCHFGGKRYWYQCPECGSRRRILYLPPSGNVFACRECHRLTYKSRQQAKNPWEPLFTYLNDVPSWQAELLRARSSKKRHRLADRIGRTCRDLVGLNARCKDNEAEDQRRRRRGRR